VKLPPPPHSSEMDTTPLNTKPSLLIALPLRHYSEIAAPPTTLPSTSKTCRAARRFLLLVMAIIIFITTTTNEGRERRFQNLSLVKKKSASQQGTVELSRVFECVECCVFSNTHTLHECHESCRVAVSKIMSLRQ
jgi:hypothetical protein